MHDSQHSIPRIAQVAGLSTAIAVTEQSTQDSVALPTVRPIARLAFLDTLRGFAAIAVLLTHIGISISPEILHFEATYFDLGHFGVMLFFLCSGFIIPLSIDQQHSLHHFWIRRFFRIFPLYWFSIAATVILAAMQTPTRSVVSILTNNLGRILANMTMLQLFLGYSNIRSEYWTLMFEMLFYLLISLLFALNLLKKSVWIAVSFLLAAILIEGVLPLVVNILVPSGIVGFLATMCVGTVTYRLYTEEVKWSTAGWVLALGLLTMICITRNRSVGNGETIRFFQMLMPRVCAYIVFIAAFLIRSYRPPRFVLYLGKISYSIYLMHPLVIETMNIGTPVQNGLAWLVCSLMIASATYYLIEHPSITLGRWLSCVRWSAIV